MKKIILTLIICLASVSAYSSDGCDKSKAGKKENKYTATECSYTTETLTCCCDISGSACAWQKEDCYDVKEYCIDRGYNVKKPYDGTQVYNEYTIDNLKKTGYVGNISDKSYVMYPLIYTKDCKCDPGYGWECYKYLSYANGHIYTPLYSPTSPSGYCRNKPKGTYIGLMRTVNNIANFNNDQNSSQNNNFATRVATELGIKDRYNLDDFSSTASLAKELNVIRACRFLAENNQYPKLIQNGEAVNQEFGFTLVSCDPVLRAKGSQGYISVPVKCHIGTIDKFEINICRQGLTSVCIEED